MGEGISGYRRMASAQFTPGDGTIAVHIEPNGIIEIAQRDIPLAFDSGLINNERKITVAGLMCEASGREHDQGETDDRALYHGLSLNLATKRLSCTSSIAVRSSIVSTGSAACGSRAARAASSRMRASRGSRCTAQLAWASCRAARGFFNRCKVKRASSP